MDTERLNKAAAAAWNKTVFDELGFQQWPGITDYSHTYTVAFIWFYDARTAKTYKIPTKED